MAMSARVLPDRFVKIIRGGLPGLNEIVRSVLMERAGLGPVVLDAYHCDVDAIAESGVYQRVGIPYDRLAIEYERLDGTMQEFLETHQSNYDLCITELTAAVRLYERAVQAGLTHLDFHYGNVMYKRTLAGLRWYLVDFGETVRLGTNRPHTSTVPRQISRNIDRLHRGKKISAFRGLM